MRLFLTVAAFAVLSVPAIAMEDHDHESHDHGEIMETMSVSVGAPHEDAILHVNGMVCDFCARSVLKVFEEKESVAGVDVDLDKALVIIHEKPDMVLSDEDIKEGIHYAGYDLEKIERVAADH